MVEINNLTLFKIDRNFFKKVAQIVLKEENVKKEKDLSIVFLKPDRMKEINKRYRAKNKVTDVLSFSGRERIGEGLGEIVICPSEVKKNAKKFAPLEVVRTGEKHKALKPLTGFGSTFKKETARVLIHGILHILGYNHEKGAKEAKKMEQKQEYYLSKI